ncbi:MAG TPA: 16S rRNA (adenine(1518)-N(6)/adenine(1519)-N(6))-dimethyltransferase RsmA [bacterium]|nr:16S rRNA (adenine(1518)-N(6)/adenine(1519)-N(6))-dimethyltransferase RsmA [bacterium]
MEFLTPGKIVKMLQDGEIEIRKHLGQNFLIDRNTRDKILSHAEIDHEDTVVEIGPGMGSLTDVLVEKAKTVYAFEIDQQLCSFLEERFAGLDNFHLIEKDFLQVSEEWWQSLPSKVKLISNTPYYMSSQIAFSVIRLREKIKTALLTVQKEVGEKITGKPGNKNYGAISVLSHIYTDSKICYSLSKNVFFPKPEVNSVVVKIEPLEKPKFHIEEEKLFRDFLSRIFMLRRKKLINVANKMFGIDKEEFKKAAKMANIVPDARAEDLSPEEICSIFGIVKDSIDEINSNSSQ